MSFVEILSLILSVFVVIVAVFTALINYLNYKAITSFSLYIRTDTKSETVAQKSLSKFPDRITTTIGLNKVFSPNSSNSAVIRWFDLILGNTGPGLVRNISWKVDYLDNGKARDLNDMHSQEPFDLGPQANLVIVGYLARDYALINGQTPSSFTSFGILPTPQGKFPWIFKLCYEIPRGIRKSLKINDEYRISDDGIAHRFIDNKETKKNIC